MSALWILPPLLLALGAVLSVVLLRTIERSADDLRSQFQEFGELREAVVAVRAENARTRAAMERLHRR